MSVGFLLASPSDAVIWRGPKKNGNKLIIILSVDNSLHCRHNQGGEGRGEQEKVRDKMGGGGVPLPTPPCHLSRSHCFGCVCLIYTVLFVVNSLNRGQSFVNSERWKVAFWFSPWQQSILLVRQIWHWYVIFSTGYIATSDSFWAICTCPVRTNALLWEVKTVFQGCS